MNIKKLLPPRGYFFQRIRVTSALLVIITLALFLLTISCVSPIRSLRKGNYERAFKSALKKLEKEKNERENKQILKRSVDKIIRTGTAEITRLEISKDLKDWEEAVAKQEKILSYYEQAIPYLDSSYFYAERQLMKTHMDRRNDLSIAYYDSGHMTLEKSINENIKAEAKEAYNKFMKAVKYSDQLPHIDSMLTACIENGVYIYTVQAEAQFDILYNWEIDRVFDKVEQSSKWLQVYYEPMYTVENADRAISANLENLNFTSSSSSSDETYSKRIIDNYKQLVDTSGNSYEEPIYEDVSITITTTVKRGEWSLDIDVQSLLKNCHQEEHFFTVQHENSIETRSTSGDKRALPENYKSSRFDEELETDQEMAIKLLEKLLSEFESACFFNIRYL